MRRRSLIVIALTGLLLCVSVAIASAGNTQTDDSGGQPLTNDHAHIFTQQRRDNLPWWSGTWIPQTVPDSAHIQVQQPNPLGP